MKLFNSRSKLDLTSPRKREGVNDRASEVARRRALG
jgi:hypothetical protein